MRTEPCLLCGGLIEADPDDPGRAVLAHVRSERHRMARGRATRPCPDCQMVTIPAWRDRCHGCTRTRELVAATRGAQLVAQHGGIRQALMATHPDHGGDPRDFADVQAFRKHAEAGIPMQTEGGPR